MYLYVRVILSDGVMRLADCIVRKIGICALLDKDRYNGRPQHISIHTRRIPALVSPDPLQCRVLKFKIQTQPEGGTSGTGGNFREKIRTCIR